MITIYTQPGCPKCTVLRMKLQQKGIAYEECADVDRMIELGIQSLPVLGVDGELMQFQDAVAYINSL